MECCTYKKCSPVICYTVDGMLHIQGMLVCYMLHSEWNVAHTGNVRLLYATQLMECCTCRQCSSVICYTVDGMLHIQAMFVCYMLHSWWNVALTGNVRLLYATQLMECCRCRQCSSVICCTVDGMLHIQAMFVSHMLYSWWNVAHTGNVRLLYATQLMECCTYRQCSSVICYTVDGLLQIQAMLVCYMLHSWWNIAHTGNDRLLYATQLMECCTYKQYSSVIWYTVDGMLHIQAMFVCSMLHNWWNVALTSNIRLLYAAKLMEYCTYRQRSSVICYTVDGMLPTQAMFVCYMLHSWWNVAHAGNVRLLYVIQLMECCTHRQCSCVICYTVDGMLHIQAMFVCYMLHSWWIVAHTGNARLLYAAQLMECCTCRQCSSVICYTVDGMLHIQAMFVCYMLHSWWNVAHTGNARLLYATQLMGCCTYRQCASVIFYTVIGMLHIQEIYACYMLHSWCNVAHAGNVRLLYATQLMECCTYRKCSSVICYTVDGMLHIQAMSVCYMLHSWWNVALTVNVRLLYATQLMECCTCRQSSSVICYTVDEWCTYRRCSSVICYTADGMFHIQAMFFCYCYTVDGMLHIQAMLVCYMLHSWWNVAHTGNVRLLYAT